MKNIDEIILKYSDTEILKFDNEGMFMDAYVELLKQSIGLISKVVLLKYCDINGLPIKIDRDEAIIGGNLTRLIKLNTSFLQNICENKLEICYILNRCVVETAINIKFLLTEGEEQVKRNYIKYSLITEKELWETIDTNIKNRNGDLLPIEKRMQKSIQNSFDKSDFGLDEVKKSSKWKSFKDRAKIVVGEMFYSVFYGNSSHAIHGNWQDILSNNLKKRGDSFELNFGWNKPRPQIMDSTISLNFDIIKTFCKSELAENTISIEIIEKCDILLNYRSYLEQSHEKWILTKIKTKL